MQECCSSEAITAVCQKPSPEKKRFLKHVTVISLVFFAGMELYFFKLHYTYYRLCGLCHSHPVWHMEN